MSMNKEKLHALKHRLFEVEMKCLRLFLFCMAFFPLMLWAQNNPFPSDKNGGVAFTETVSSELPRDAMFSRVKAWVHDAFPGIQELQYESEEAGKIIAKGFLERLPVEYQDENESVYEKARFMITIECKEKSLFFSIHDIELISVTCTRNSERESSITHGDHYMNILYYCNCITNEKNRLQAVRGLLKGKKLKAEMELHHATLEKYNRLIKYEEDIDEAEYDFFIQLGESLKNAL